MLNVFPGPKALGKSEKCCSPSKIRYYKSNYKLITEFLRKEKIELLLNTNLDIPKLSCVLVPKDQIEVDVVLNLFLKNINNYILTCLTTKSLNKHLTPKMIKKTNCTL